jgi:UDP-N-acetylmuramoyl-L-alanyl-D-glutamate--2,6-diaminopimelate ligase
VTIVTTDNPRSEDPALIAAAVEKGAISVSKSAVRVVLDRREAIAEAVRMADQGDLVLILGKGHEEGQEIRGVKLPFNDALVAAESLATREVGP